MAGAGIEGVVVTSLELAGFHGGRRFSVNTPAEVQDFIVAFDALGAHGVRPFSFDLGIG